jgi:DNA (cytosine-5)-methyltransferase 1
MNYISVCSGIEAATVAWESLGWNALAYSDIDSHCQSLLKYHYPNVPVYGDFTTINEKNFNNQSIDLLVGGTPCQSFSVAGLRRGLDDERGNLSLEFFRLAKRLKPKWILWENVPGVLTIDEGRGFKSILSAMDELGYGYAWRVLNAQYFGVPQRRRRIFLVGYLGDWKYPTASLFDSKSMFGNSQQSKTSKKNYIIQYSKDFTKDYRELSFDGYSFQLNGNVCSTLSTKLSHNRNLIFGIDEQGNEYARRITPIEAERLQGFPDNYTLIPHNGKLIADSHRYKFLGNSMAVPVMRWIGERINFLQKLK